MKNFNQKNKGFTLVETLIAITILMIAIAGPLTLTQSGIFSAIQARGEITSFFLAQEAIEYIKNMRDNNKHVAGVHWLKGIAEESDDPCYFGKSCGIDPYTDEERIFDCADKFSLSGACGALRLKEYTANRHIYTHDTTTDDSVENSTSPYTRTIQLSRVTGTNDEVKVTVTMTWRNAGNARTFVVSENIYNLNR